MPTPETLLEIRSYTGEGYLPLVDFANWRVAVLNFIDELLPEQIERLQRHDTTDEVFVLLQGHCILLLGEGGESISRLYAEDMQPLQTYNIKRSTWHSHTLSPDAVVLIVENRDTDDSNSPYINLTPAQRTELVEMVRRQWSPAMT